MNLNHKLIHSRSKQWPKEKGPTIGGGNLGSSSIINEHIHVIECGKSHSACAPTNLT